MLLDRMAGRTSFLRRVTKYVDRPGLKQAENRLTEVTAGILEHVDGFAVELVEEMLRLAAENFDRDASSVAASPPRACALQAQAEEMRQRRGRVRAADGCRADIRTQLGTDSGGFVDLQIRLRPDVFDSDRDLVFWVEVKHGAGLSGEQLPVYQRDAPPNGLVLVLAPRQSMPKVDDRMPLVAWQQLAEVIRGRRREARAGTSEQFVLNAYITYLEEEGLMDAEALTPSHAIALAQYESASGLLARLCERTDSQVERQWARRDPVHPAPGTPKDVAKWSATYPLRRDGAADPSPTWRESFLEWGLRDDEGREEGARRTMAFVAGAWMTENNPVEANCGWVSRLRDDSFAVYKGHFQRVSRFLYFEQLLAETTLDGQATYLLDWVLKTFEYLTDPGNGPPN